MIRTRRHSIALILSVASVWAIGCEGVLQDSAKQRPSAVGVLDAGDAASVENDDACTMGCTVGSVDSGAPARCGDGRLNSGEQCDDGNTTSGDGCDSQCVVELIPPGPACGDGLLDTEREECDDGNTVPGDGCDWRCRKERCGNDRRDVGEDCDPPVTGVCDQSCRTVLPNCGDGVLQEDEGEQCDDGNATRGDGCNACREECGDDLLERDIGEECEPKYAAENTCDPETCKRLPLCGDGKVDEAAGEQCDPSDGVQCVNCMLSNDAGTVDAGVEAPQCVATMPQVTIVNGDFASDLVGWTPASVAVGATLAASGANSGAGSVEVLYTAGAVANTMVDGVVQCVPIQAGVAYTLALQYYNPAANAPGVLPGISIKLYDSLNCAGGFSSGSGPSVSSARDTWLQFVRAVDTSALGDDGHLASMEVKLGVIVPSGVVSGTLRFDDVALGSCGNCIVDDAAGESCDDGNQLEGDGCSSTCEFECGNGQVDTPEDCDDGNFAFGDSCTPSCRTMTSCDNCVKTSCAAAVSACFGLEGVAQGGDRRGMPRSALCARLRDCIHDTGCNANTAIANRATLAGPTPTNPANPGLPENCYCGNAGVDCMVPGAANGSCRAEIEAALETSDPYQIIQRVGGYDPDFPLFEAVADLLTCEQTVCSGQCAKSISCGNGLIEDRSQQFVTEFSFLIERLPQPCLDGYTHTQTGCSFEECDDGNTENDDGCDEHCFVEACGNHLKQGLEECDDGNLIDGDGCDSNCVAEYVCGDDEVTAPFEECEPPGSGAVCSLADYEEDPENCGCDAACIRKVCGNLVVQEGEECDPPNGASCDDSCQRSVDECTECLLLINETQFCSSDLFFNGSGVPDPFETGCLQESSCMDLWGCMRDTQCQLERGPAACYCGATADFNACEGPSFVPTGECKDEFLAAFEVQWGRPPTNNSELLAGSVLGSSNNNPYSLGSYITQYCLLPDSSEQITPLRIQLEDSGVSVEDAAACVAACFP